MTEADVVGVFLLSICMLGTVGPWVWIAWRGAKASAWGDGKEDLFRGVSSQGLSSLTPAGRLPSMAFQAHLRGRGLWLILLLFLVGAMLFIFVREEPGNWQEIVLSYGLCWMSAGVILIFAWFRIGRPMDVPPGLMAVFFLSGGILGILYAVVFEILAELAWVLLLPTCSMEYFDSEVVNRGNAQEEVILPMTYDCGIVAATMWILTPGLIEETGKALWLFFRLRSNESYLPKSCCLCLPSKHSDDCGCWFKLAPSPYHVLLCALSAGAGFECVENVKYVFGVPTNGAPGKAGLLSMAVARSLTSGCHMAWTGLIGLGLARRMFPSGRRTPSLLMVVLPSVVCHGLFDFSITMLSSVALRIRLTIIGQQVASDIQPCMLLLLLITSVGSCCVLSCRTGFRICPPSCCCVPDFFFPEDLLAREPQGSADPQREEQGSADPQREEERPSPVLQQPLLLPQ